MPWCIGFTLQRSAHEFVGTFIFCQPRCTHDLSCNNCVLCVSFLTKRFFLRQDEMLLFMEYCSGGTLADAARHGLSEEIIRKYTHEVLVAISVLHDKQVVHRDIKGVFTTRTSSNTSVRVICCFILCRTWYFAAFDVKFCSEKLTLRGVLWDNWSSLQLCFCRCQHISDATWTQTRRFRLCRQTEEPHNAARWIQEHGWNNRWVSQNKNLFFGFAPSGEACWFELHCCTRDRLCLTQPTWRPKWWRATHRKDTEEPPISGVLAASSLKWQQEKYATMHTFCFRENSCSIPYTCTTTLKDLDRPRPLSPSHQAGAAVTRRLWGDHWLQTMQRACFAETVARVRKQLHDHVSRRDGRLAVDPGHAERRGAGLPRPLPRARSAAALDRVRAARTPLRQGAVRRNGSWWNKMTGHPKWGGTGVLPFQFGGGTNGQAQVSFQLTWNV